MAIAQMNSFSLALDVPLLAFEAGGVGIEIGVLNVQNRLLAHYSRIRSFQVHESSVTIAPLPVHEALMARLST